MFTWHVVFFHLEQARRSTENPNFIDGLPLPTHSNDTFAKAPNPYDFNPLDAVVPLGQKPLPSAYRQSSNVCLLKSLIKGFFEVTLWCLKFLKRFREKGTFNFLT